MSTKKVKSYYRVLIAFVKRDIIVWEGDLMKDLSKKFGIRIKEIRKTVKMTQERLAEKTELSVEYISRLERGVAQPSFKTLSMMADVLNVDVKDFFDFKSPVIFKNRKQTEEKEKEYIEAISNALTQMEIRELAAVYNVVKGLTEK